MHFDVAQTGNQRTATITPLATRGALLLSPALGKTKHTNVLYFFFIRKGEFDPNTVNEFLIYDSISPRI